MALNFQEVAQKYPLDEYIDLDTFEQLLEMDEDDDREFSKSIAHDFYSQAEDSFNSMEIALDAKNLRELSGMGHFMKGSSATLGLIKIKDCCEQIQSLGLSKDPYTQDTISDEQALNTISKLLVTLRQEYAQTRQILQAMGY